MEHELRNHHHEIGRKIFGWLLANAFPFCCSPCRLLQWIDLQSFPPMSSGLRWPQADRAVECNDLIFLQSLCICFTWLHGCWQEATCSEGFLSLWNSHESASDSLTIDWPQCSEDSLVSPQKCACQWQQNVWCCGAAHKNIETIKFIFPRNS